MTQVTGTPKFEEQTPERFVVCPAGGEFAVWDNETCENVDFHGTREGAEAAKRFWEVVS